MSTVAGASIPEEYFNAQTAVGTGFGMLVFSAALLANEMVVYNEIIKMVVFDVISMMLFQTPHMLLVAHLHIRFTYRSR